MAALAKHIRNLSDELRRSLTEDRSNEKDAHSRFSFEANVAVYLCDPRTPWLRGSNENTNGLLRQYFPEDDDVSRYSQADLHRVAR